MHRNPANNVAVKRTGQLWNELDKTLLAEISSFDLEHINIIDYKGLTILKGQLCFVMERCNGSLLDLIAKGKHFSQEEIAYVAREVSLKLSKIDNKYLPANLSHNHS